MFSVTLDLGHRWWAEWPTACPPDWPIDTIHVSAGSPEQRVCLGRHPLLPFLKALAEALDRLEHGPATVGGADEVVLHPGGGVDAVTMCYFAVDDTVTTPFSRDALKRAIAEARQHVLEHISLRWPAHPPLPEMIRRDIEAALACPRGDHITLRAAPDGVLFCIADQAPVLIPKTQMPSIVGRLCTAAETSLKTRSWPGGQWEFALDDEGQIKLRLQGRGAMLEGVLVDRGRLPLTHSFSISAERLADAAIWGAGEADLEDERPLHEAQQLGRWARTLRTPPFALTLERGHGDVSPQPARAVPEGSPLPVKGLHHLAYRRRWRQDDLNPSKGSIRVVGDHVQYSAGDQILTLDRRTGETLWTHDHAHLPPCPGPLDLLLDAAGCLIRVDTDNQTQRWQATIGDGGLSALDLSDDALLVGGVDGALQRLSAETGELIWRRHTLHGAVSSVVTSDTACWCLGEDGLVYGLRQNDGMLAFAFPLAGEPEGAPLLTAAGLLVVSHAGPGFESQLTLLDPYTGTVEWTRTLEGTAITASAQVGEDAVLILERLEGLYMVRVALADGGVRWQLDLPTEAESDPGTLTVLDELACIKGMEGETTGVDLQRGKILWQVSAEAGSDALVSNAAVVACRGLLLIPGSTVRAIDPQTGRVIHSLPCEDLVPSWIHVWPDGDLLVAEDNALAYFFLGGHLGLV
ncbi:MAG: PQQ-binding-like beta-propeller repeat protein [Bradymonadia bacterium]